MLVFFFACFFFQTLRGAPLTPDASPLLSARESPPEPDQQHRTTFDIIRSCLLTIFACIWQSAHPNLNGPRDSGWTCFKRKIATMLCALIAPELVLYWAFKQRSVAKRIAAHYNSKFAISSAYKYLGLTGYKSHCISNSKADLDQKSHKSPWRTIVAWFHPLPKETTRRGAGQAWTTTHGFFLQMGGFILYSNSYPVKVLTYKELISLLDKKEIGAPTVTERELQDRSKGDWVSKSIILMQTTWFVVQCLARLGRRLPLSELEVTTLASALMNVAIYAAWWNKPQGVDTAISVLWKTVEERETSADQHKPAAGGELLFSVTDGNNLPRPRPDSRGHSCMSNNKPHEHVHEHIEDEQIEHASFKWLRSKVPRNSGKYPSSLVYLLRLPYLLFMLTLRIINKVGGRSFDAKYLRVPMFYVYVDTGPDRSDLTGVTYEMLLPIMGALFGAVHLLAWSSEFPTTRDLVLWRVSAVILTGIFVHICGLTLVVFLLKDKTNQFWTCVKGFIVFLVFFPLIFYIPARFVLIFVAFNAMRNTPTGVLVDIPWTSYLPHF